jgi:Na+/phosphate symporter
MTPHRVLRAVQAIAGLALFILALETLKTGAQGLVPLLARLHVDGLRQSVGFGWLAAYVVLSGSPVAAISLSLYSSQVISDVMVLGMITGSRLGASFIVLFVGFLYHLRGHQRVASIAVGVLAFTVTATIYLPALALGYFILTEGWFDAIRFGMPATLDSVIDLAFGPVVNLLEAYLPYWAIFLVGVGVLLAAFRVFDKVLPEIEAEHSALGNLATTVYRPLVMFAVGALFTTVTLSVSVSLTLLVPLASRGYIRRENIIPYIMGANITTFVDTLFASLLLSAPRAFTIVLVEVATVSFFSLLILGLFYLPYQRALNRLLQVILKDNRSLTLFVALTVGIPLLLLLWL